MAADISVLMELDDRKYQQGLKRAETSAVQFGNKFASATRGVDTALNGINQKLGAMTQLLIGAGLGAFIANISKGATELTNMSRALGITTESFMEMSQAAASVGVNATGLMDRISEMTNRVAGAAAGNLEYRRSFQELGISIEDMRNLAPDELFNKVVAALAKIEDPARRAAEASRLLGEEGRKIDWAGYTQGLTNAEGKMGSYAKAQENVAKVTKDLAEFAELLKMEFANLLSPIASLISSSNSLEDRMNAAGVAAKVLAAALGAFAVSTAISGIRAIVASVGAAAAAFGVSSVATAANTKLTMDNAGAQIFLAGAYGRLGTAVTAVATLEAQLAALLAAGPPQAAALASVTEALSAARARLAAANEALVVTEAAAQRMQGAGSGALSANTTATTANTTAKTANATATAAVGTASTAAAGGIGAMTVATNTLTASLGRVATVAGIATGALAFFYSKDLNEGEEQTIQNMRELGEKLKQLDTSELEKYYELINKQPDINPSDALAQVAPGKFGKSGNGVLGGGEWKQLNEQMKQRAVGIANETQMLITQNARVKERTELEIQLAGQSRAMREAILATFDAETTKRQKVYDIANKIRELEAQIAADPYKAQQEGLQLVVDAYRAQLQEVYKLTDGVYELALKEAERTDALEMQKYILEQQSKAQDELLNIENEIADLTRTEGERRLAQVDRLIEREKKLAIEKRKSQLGVTGDLELAEVKAIEDQIEAAYGGLRGKTQELLDKSRSFETGWKKAMKTYVDEATNGAKKAESIFNKAFQGMEDLLVNFAKTGKFEWKQFVAMMLEELLRAQIQAVFASMIGDMSGAMNNSMGGGGGMLGGLFGGGKGGSGGGIGDLLGGAWDTVSGWFGGGSKQPSGWEFGPGNRDDQKPAAGGGVWDTVKSVGSGAWDAVSSVGSGVWDTAKSVGSGVWDAVSSVGSGVWDTVSSVGSGVWDAVSSVGSGVWDTVSSVGSAIGDFFGGFFADGGRLGAGKWGIAGEAGPEIIHGPANITPMKDIGGGSTNVTYNINAVDARSFKQLIASDPAFIHGIVMAGAKGIPARR